MKSLRKHTLKHIHKKTKQNQDTEDTGANFKGSQGPKTEQFEHKKFAAGDETLNTH